MSNKWFMCGISSIAVAYGAGILLAASWQGDSNKTSFQVVSVLAMGFAGWLSGKLIWRADMWEQEHGR